MNNKEYQAYGNGTSVVASSPREAARRYFEQCPTRRKCNVIEGVSDGHFFRVSYGRKSCGQWPLSFKDVTKKKLNDLPE